METSLSKTICVWPKFVHLTHEDQAFLEGNRVASFGCFDKKLTDKVQRWETRDQAELERCECASQSSQDPQLQPMLSSESEETIDEEHVTHTKTQSSSHVTSKLPAFMQHGHPSWH